MVMWQRAAAIDTNAATWMVCRLTKDKWAELKVLVMSLKFHVMSRWQIPSYSHL